MRSPLPSKNQNFFIVVNKLKIVLNLWNSAKKSRNPLKFAEKRKKAILREVLYLLLRMTRLSKVLLVSGLLASTTPSHSPIQPQETTRKATQVALAKEMQEDTPVYSIAIKDLEGGPYFGKKKMITPNYGNLLGFSQAETILRGYNAFPDSLEFSPVQRVEVEETINIPLIYPELKEYFPEKRDSLLYDKDFEKYQDIKTDHLLVASQCDNGKVALAYYEK